LKSFLATAAGVVLLALVAYSASIGYPYVQDSVSAVERNPVVERGDVGEIFASHYWKDTLSSQASTLYRPLTVLSFAFERKIVGQTAARTSHAVNLLLHVAVALLLFAYARRIGSDPRVAALAALLFVAHPVLTQGVVSVVGRADLLATSLSLAALLALSFAGPWRSGNACGPLRRRLGSWGGGALVFLALGSKEIAVAMPLLLVVQELLFRPRPGTRVSRRWLERGARLAPAAIAVAVYLVLRARAIGDLLGAQGILPMDNVLLGTAGVTRVATVLAMAGRYAGLLVFPIRLSGDYSGTVIARHDSLVGLLPLAGLVLLGASLFLALRPFLSRAAGDDPDADGRDRRLSMAAWIFLLPYAVVGNVIVLNAAGFAERLIYFSTVGAALAAATLAFGALERLGRIAPPLRRLGQAAIAVLLVVAAWHARGQARMWESDEALLEHTLRSTPRSLRANVKLAELRMRQGDAEEALRLYDRALLHSPDHGPAWAFKGHMLVEQGDLGDAESALRRAIEVRPDMAEPYLQLGRVLAMLGRLEESERAVDRAVLLKPDLALNALEIETSGCSAATLFESNGDLEAAGEVLRRCAAGRPGEAEPRLALARLLIRQKRFDAAETELRGVLERQPGLEAAERQLGELQCQRGVQLGQRGELDAAEAALRDCVARLPNEAGPRVYLAIALGGRGSLEEAESVLRSALEIDPQLVEAEARLGHVLLQTGRYAEAAQHYRRCVERGRDDLRRYLEQAESRATGGGG